LTGAVQREILVGQNEAFDLAHGIFLRAVKNLAHVGFRGQQISG
jgi:hypothetical protein